MSFDWLNKHSEQFLSRGYLRPGQTGEERVKEIADHFGSLRGKEKGDKFFKYAGEGYYSFASPVWSNYGDHSKGYSVSCFGSYIEDSIPSILETVSEVGAMSQKGGGCSGYLGNIRPRGSKVNNGRGATSGSVHFLELFETLTEVISQSGVRRGFFTPYLDAEHGDIEEFIAIGSEGVAVQTLTTGVNFSDEFMQRVKNKDRDALAVWAKWIMQRKEVGYPYGHWVGNVNKNTVDVYRDKGMKIVASNMCIAGEDRVVTSKGYLTARELWEMGEDLTLFDGEKPVRASAMHLREKDADTYKITLANGMEHTVTSYHGLPVVIGRDVVRKECKDVRIGDKIALQTKKGLFGNKSMEKEAFLLGLYQSDGTQHKDIIMLEVWENDFDILDEVQEAFNEVHYKYGCDKYLISNQTGATSSYRSRQPAKFAPCYTAHSDVKKMRLASKTLHKALNFQKGFVPDWIWECDEPTQWEYVRGLMIADGTVHKSKSSGEPIQVAYSDINLGFLKELQILFNNLGMRSSIHLLRKGGSTLLPDGKGGQAYYETKDCYRLVVGNKPDAIELNKHTGFLDRKGVVLEDRVYRDNIKKTSEVVSIEYAGKQDVFCPTVYNDEHIFVAQGMKTFNCNEIELPSSPEESFVCVLSAMNIMKWEEWKDTDAVEIMTEFLDTVVDDFITKLERERDSGSDGKKTFEMMKRAYRFAKRHRALGIGSLGLADYLMSKGIAFESDEAAEIDMAVHKHIQERAWAASKDMAERLGEPDVLKGYGRRNTTLTALMPTKSSSFILGQTSQTFEPRMSNYYTEDLAKTKYMYKNPHLKELLKKKGYDTREVWNSIANNDGSVQHLVPAILSEEEAEVFKTFGEINPYVIIDRAAQRQQYVDQGQSLNLMIGPKFSPKEISQLYIHAWESGIKGVYYSYNTNSSQELARKADCPTCSI